MADGGRTSAARFIGALHWRAAYTRRMCTPHHHIGDLHTRVPYARGVRAPPPRAASARRVCAPRLRAASARILLCVYLRNTNAWVSTCDVAQVRHSENSDTSGLAAYSFCACREYPGEVCRVVGVALFQIQRRALCCTLCKAQFLKRYSRTIAQSLHVEQLTRTDQILQLTNAIFQLCCTLLFVLFRDFSYVAKVLCKEAVTNTHAAKRRLSSYRVLRESRISSRAVRSRSWAFFISHNGSSLFIANADLSYCAHDEERRVARMSSARGRVGAQSTSTISERHRNASQFSSARRSPSWRFRHAAATAYRLPSNSAEYFAYTTARRSDTTTPYGRLEINCWGLSSNSCCRHQRVLGATGRYASKVHSRVVSTRTLLRKCKSVLKDANARLHLPLLRLECACIPASLPFHHRLYELRPPAGGRYARCASQFGRRFMHCITCIAWHCAALAASGGLIKVPCAAARHQGRQRTAHARLGAISRGARDTHGESGGEGCRETALNVSQTQLRVEASNRMVREMSQQARIEL
eukprot:IDg1835t1